MNSVVNLILAAAVLFSAAPASAGCVGQVVDLTESDDYIITYDFTGEQVAAVSGYGFSDPPTVGDSLPLTVSRAEYVGRVETSSGLLWRFGTDNKTFNAFSGDLHGVIPEQGQTYIIIAYDNNTPEQIDDDIIIGFLEEV